MESRVRKVRRASSRSVGTSRVLPASLLVVALVLIVILINLFLGPARPKGTATSQGGATIEEAGGTTNALPQPRSHLIY